MSAERFDIIVFGSGFAGTLMSLVARRLGYSVLLLEKGKHPRFAIGESSTPLTNLLLEIIARDFDLPRLLPLTKWGAWQKSLPNLPVGLKRGFNFYHHFPGEEFARTKDHDHELLVAASPNDTIADTHWYRPAFDHFLVQEAQREGVIYRDGCAIDKIDFDGDEVGLVGRARETELQAQASLVIDASGPNGVVRNALNLPVAEQKTLVPTEGLYSHFVNVAELQSIPPFNETSGLPYAEDASAVHHLFEGGWVWVLRFNNGITSAGISAANSLAAELKLAEGEPAWRRLLQRYPTLQRQFGNAKASAPFRHHSPLPFRLKTCTGRNWVLLPSATGFVDPLLSTGFPLTLLGILRLARLLKGGIKPEVSWASSYEEDTLADLHAVELLIGALFRNLHRPDVFRPLLHLYFAPILFCETATRLNKRSHTAPFLLRDDEKFWGRTSQLLHLIISNSFSRDFQAPVENILREYDLAGFFNRDRRNWHPADSAVLVRNAAKVGATACEMQEMLRRCGAVETMQLPFLIGVTDEKIVS